jgi:dsRNA-specific ribonuclease
MRMFGSAYAELLNNENIREIGCRDLENKLI